MSENNNYIKLKEESIDKNLISQIFKKISNQINSDDGIKATLIALKNNISMKEHILNIEKESIEEDILSFERIYSYTPNLKENVLKKLLKNLFEITKRLDESMNFIKTEIDLSEKEILKSIIKSDKDFFFNLFNSILTNKQIENDENEIMEENNFNYEKNNSYLLFIYQDVIQKTKNLFSEYLSFKQKFEMYFLQRKTDLSKFCIVFFNECEDLSKLIKEHLNNL